MFMNSLEVAASLGKPLQYCLQWKYLNGIKYSLGESMLIKIVKLGTKLINVLMSLEANGDAQERAQPKAAVTRFLFSCKKKIQDQE